MKFFITLFTCLLIVLSAFSQSKSYYFIQAQKNIELEVADSISAITWEKQNESGDFEILSGSSANVYAAPTESGTYRVLYHASCGDIISDSIEVVVYDTITEVINYTQVGAHHFYKSGVSPKEMKVLEFEAADLLQAGYSIENMALGGYFLEEFRAAGVSDAELTAAGIIGSITDTDGKIYTWVRVGEQIWMAQNMAYSCETKAECRGDECYPIDITYIESKDQYFYFLSRLGSIVYCDCGIAVCPEGWHVPSRTEWVQLFETVGYDFSTQALSEKDIQFCRTADCTDFAGQSRPLFIGGATGLNFDYDFGFIEPGSDDQLGEGEWANIIMFHTSSMHRANAPLGVLFNKITEGTYFDLYSTTLVRCMKD